MTACKLMVTGCLTAFIQGIPHDTMEVRGGLAVVKALVLALDGNVGASVQDNNLKIILEL